MSRPHSPPPPTPPIYHEPAIMAMLDAESHKLDSMRARIEELEAALEHRERQIDAMRRAGDTLFTARSVADLVRETLETAIEVLSADAGSLLLFNEREDTLIFQHVIGPAAKTLTGFSMPSKQGIAGRVFHSGTPDLTQKATERAEFNSTVDEKTGYRTESMLTVPVKRADSRPIGVMQVLNARELFDHRDLEVLEVLSAVAAAAFENARLAQEARKAAIVNVIGDVSHDIKNMLTPIQSGVWTLEPMLDELFEALDGIRQTCPASESYSKQIEEAALGVREDYKWILAGALDAAEKVQARTKEIADALKGEIAPPNFETDHLNEVVEEVVRALTIVAHDSHVALKLDLDPNLPPADFDRKQMYNAIYNLVNNAIPETKNGTITVHTRAGDESECVQDGVLQSQSVFLEVRDTGKGIPENVRRRLFTDEAISTKPGGTGLGTRIVAGVVRRHNGKIEVESEEGKGSLFRIQFPLRHSAQAEI
jgi:signal transduction histidine kinase